MITFLTKRKKLLKTELHDDKTPFGGVSYQGQTLGDFLDEVCMPKNSSIKKINIALIACGIKPIHVAERR